MNTEEFIRDGAARGWSRTRVREALGIHSQKFWQMLEHMPGVVWPEQGKSLGNRLGNASKRGGKYHKMEASLVRARQRRLELHTYEVNGRRGTIDQLAAASPVSASTVRRRISADMSLEQALSIPCTPPNKRRAGGQLL